MKQRTDPLTVLLGMLGILVFVFLFLPIVVILVYSFNNGTLLAAWRGFGFDAYSAAAGNSVIRGAVATSLIAAAGSALLSTVLGTLAGIALARSTLARSTSKQGRSVKFWAIGLTVLLGLTMVTPEIVDAVSLLPWFVSLGTDLGITPLNNGLLRLVIAHSVVSIAIVTFIVRARMQGVDQSLEEAAEDLYASKWHAFWQVTFPIASPGILAGALMSFTVSLDNTIVSSFVQVPGSTPWPVYIFSSLKVGLKPEVAAVSAVMFVLTLLALAFVAVVLRRTGGSTKEIAATMTGG